MKNRDYWRQRFIILQEAQEKESLAEVDALDNAYKKATASLQDDINRWYSKFANNNEISLSEAKRQLTNNELKEFHWSVQEYIKYGEANGLDGTWTKQLTNASAKYHISRLEALKLQVQQQVEELFGNRLDKTDAFIRAQYSDRYYHSALEIQKGVGVGWQLDQFDGKQLNTLLKKPWTTDGKTFSDKIWNNKAQLLQELQTGLMHNLITGDSPDNLIQLVSKKMNVSYNRAKTLVMSESAFFASVAQKNCFNDLDVEKYVIVATLDDVTSDTCQDLDGEIFKMSEFEPGVTAPPFHANCRSVTAPYFEDIKDLGERFARDPKTGETYKVPKNISYEEWYKKYVVEEYGENEAKIIKKMTQKEASDKKQYSKYKLIYGENGPKTFADFREMKYYNSEEWETLKSNKQATLNSLDYQPSMDAKFGNAEVRAWYRAHDNTIINSIDKTKSLQEQAKEAFTLRNTYRTQARKMMSDIEAAKELNAKERNMSFEELLERKKNKYGLTGEEAYKDIIRSSQTTRAEIDQKFEREK